MDRSVCCSFTYFRKMLHLTPLIPVFHQILLQHSTPIKTDQKVTDKIPVYQNKNKKILNWKKEHKANLTVLGIFFLIRARPRNLPILRIRCMRKDASPFGWIRVYWCPGAYIARLCGSDNWKNRHFWLRSRKFRLLR